ncbi:hypothetical protein [Sphingomonas lacusdianchii]|uniref:hypothetical protein n=1 Tax=Sphingomonas lacusdianchii TaxID=2917992 RepID=UPI001F594643|nr:hypothetical protein [Sphingomonas sp. JXJ CY 53]
MLMFVTTLFVGLVGQQATSSSPPVATAPKLICKRTLDTGSNVRGKKVCLTAKQWDQVARQGQELGRSMLPALVTQNQ